MFIKKVNFDEALLKAQQENNLVIFAGAGVSMGPPSNYPSFPGLAKAVANWASQPWVEGEPIEHFLGGLVDRGVDVHKYVADYLSVPSSKHKKLHENLIDVFGRDNEIRIVTTNFDNHFETASKKLKITSQEVFRAPALPLGNDFAGIVYLHGSVNGDPKNLILTDQDFGRAYLTEGWATNFLKALFSKYCVMFIGYSHNDVVMHYLSRGLPPTNIKQRFALVKSDTNLDEWLYRGIEPITFDVDPDGGYKFLENAISEWSDISNRGALETERRIKEIVSQPPSIDNERQDYLLWSLKNISSLRYFIRHATSPEWLEWASVKGILRALFSKNQISEDGVLLSEWIAGEFTLKNPDTAFRVIEQGGDIINDRFASALLRKLSYGSPSPEADVINRWIPIIIRQDAVAKHGTEYSELLKRAIKKQAYAAVVMIIDHLTRVIPKLRVSLSFPAKEKESKHKADIELKFRGECRELCIIWRKQIRPELKNYAIAIWPALIQNLNSAFYHYKSWNKARESWDPISMRRPGIEPHEKNRYFDIPDFIIDAVRDCLEWAIGNEPKIGMGWIDNLFKMEPPIFKRLALHGLNLNVGFTANEKIEFVINEELLLVPFLKHEVFILLKVNYPLADFIIRER